LFEKLKKIIKYHRIVIYDIKTGEQIKDHPEYETEGKTYDLLLNCDSTILTAVTT